MLSFPPCDPFSVISSFFSPSSSQPHPSPLHPKPANGPSTASPVAIVVAPDNAKTDAAPLIFSLPRPRRKNERASLPNPCLRKAWPEAIVVYPQGLPTPGRLTDKERQTPRLAKRPRRTKRPRSQILRSRLRQHENRFQSRPCPHLLHPATPTAPPSLTSSGAPAANNSPPSPPSPHPCPSSSPNPKPKASTSPKPSNAPSSTSPAKKTRSSNSNGSKRTIDYLRKFNHCTEGKPWDDNEHCTIYLPRLHAPVVAYNHNGGHDVPHDAVDVIVKFFKENPKPPAK